MNIASDARDHDGHLCFDYDGQTVSFAHAIEPKAARRLYDCIDNIIENKVLPTPYPSQERNFLN